MLLHEENLRREIDAGHLRFNGHIRKDSLLLSLGEHLQTLSQGPDEVDPYVVDSVVRAYGPLLSQWGQFALSPHQMVLVASKEYLALDDSHYATIETLSHLARLGLMAHCASSYVDRGFCGHLTFEIVNVSPRTIILHQNMPFAKLMVFRCNQLSLGCLTPYSAIASYGKPDELCSQYPQEFSRHS
jgi:deoxycytidine triphosphate deaminase